MRFPVANPDFSAFVQRAKDIAPESIYIFIPGGAQPAALGKAFAERGIDKKKTRVLGSGETTAEPALKRMGDTALDIITAWHYDYKGTTPLNAEFVKEFNAMHGRNPDFFSIGGYDGMHAIYETLKKTGGKTDGETMIAAAKGLKWESPRGPMSIDPGDARRGADRLHPPRAEGRQRAGQRAVRQDRERQGSVTRGRLKRACLRDGEGPSPPGDGRAVGWTTGLASGGRRPDRLTMMEVTRVSSSTGSRTSRTR